MIRRGVLTGLVIPAWFGVLVVGGCVVENKPSVPERERPRSVAPPRPAGVRPQQMTLSAGVGMDSDGNGYPDTIPVVVYLFADTRRYPLPIKERGEFTFELTAAEGVEIGSWVFGEEESARAVGDSAAGVCYRFALRLGPGRDRLPAVPASLRAIFTNTATGERFASPGSATIRVGSGE